MAERAQPIEAPGERAEAERSELGDAVLEAGAAGFGARPAYAARINTLLRALGPGPRAQADANLLLDALEKDAFDGLEDFDGVACRVEAVDALLRLGYPWALQVHPRDLEQFRGAKRRRRWLLPLVLGAIVAAAAAGGLAWFFGSTEPRPPQNPIVRVRPAHVALQKPMLAPRELIVGNTVTTATATRHLVGGSRVVDLTVRAESSDRTTSPQLEVKAFGLYDERDGALVLNLPAEQVGATTDPIGQRSVHLSVPLPAEIVDRQRGAPEDARYFAVLDTSVNGMPVRALRSDVATYDPLPPRSAFDQPPSLVAPLALSRPVRAPSRMLVSVDADGTVADVLPLSTQGLEGVDVEKALRQARFRPAQLNGRPVGATFVFQYPADVGSSQGPR